MSNFALNSAAFRDTPPASSPPPHVFAPPADEMYAPMGDGYGDGGSPRKPRRNNRPRSRSGAGQGRGGAQNGDLARLISLDVFRGLVVLLMLLANNVPAGVVPPASWIHANWGRMPTLADCLFPWFLFVVGVALPFAQQAARRRRLSVASWNVRALRHALLLVALGILVDSLATGILFRGQIAFGLGVMQLAGVASLVALVSAPFLSPRGRFVLAAVLLFAWTLLLRTPPMAISASAGVSFVPTPGRNLPLTLNQLYLDAWNLRGLLSVIPATAIVLLGSLAGDLLRRTREAWQRKTGILLVAGASLFAGGAIWAKPGGILSLPIARAIWSPPYVLLTVGCGVILLALCYALFDGLRERRQGRGDARRRGRSSFHVGDLSAKLVFPLVVLGANAVVAYVLPIVVKFLLLKRVTLPNSGGDTLERATRAVCDSVARGNTQNGGWLYLALFVAATWLVLFALWRRKMFLRV